MQFKTKTLLLKAPLILIFIFSFLASCIALFKHAVGFSTPLIMLVCLCLYFYGVFEERKKRTETDVV